MDARSVAIFDTDTYYRERLAAAMDQLGVPARGYDDLAKADADALNHAGHVLGLAPVASRELVRQLRRRGRSAILLLSDGVRPEAAQAAPDAGAAQHVAKFKAIKDVAASVVATMSRAWQRGGVIAWQLDSRARQLVAPDGARIDLSVDELEMLACLRLSTGNAVSRDAILGRQQAAHGPGSSDPVHAAMLRLQRRAERLTPMSLPFRVWARTGYSFDGHLEEA